MRRRLFIASLAALAVALPPAAQLRAASPVAWRSERVDAAAERPWLALDGAGRPHVAYGSGGTTRYALRAGAAWQAETVARGTFPVLAVDSADQPHVVYADSTDRAATAIRYARKVAGAWVTELVESIGVGGHPGGLAVGPDGSVHAAYYQPNPSFSSIDAALTYARRDPVGRWTAEVVVRGPASGAHHGLALDAAGVPHLSIGAGTLGAGWIRHGRRDAGGWTVEAASRAQSGQDNAIALDSTGHPRIAYFEAAGSNLMYASRSDAGWTTELVADVEPASAGRNPSLAIDRTGEPRILFELGHGLQGLAAARREGGRWTWEMVDPRGKSPSLAIDAAGVPHAAYLDDGALRYATGSVLGVRRLLPLVLQRASP